MRVLALTAMMLAGVSSSPAKSGRVAPPVVQAQAPVIHVSEAPSPEYRQRMERARREREVIQQRRKRSRATVAVEVSGGGQSLWSGTLRVGYPSGAQVQRSLTQAPPIECVVDEERSYRAGRNSFDLRLNNPQFPDAETRMSFNIEWQRAAETCAEAQYTRGVQLSGSLQLTEGESVTVTGDGGLVAKFRLVNREIGTDAEED